MKDIKEFINESLINEASGKVIAFFDHFSPEITFLVIGADEKLIDDISEGYQAEVIPNKGNLLDITHSDEWGWLVDLGCKTESQLKSKSLKTIEKCIKKGVEKDYAYIEYDPIPFGNEYEDYNGVEDYTKWSAEDWYQELVDMYNNSFIDGDSSSARVIYDPNKKEVVFGSGTEIICFTPEEYQEWVSDNE